MCFRHISIDAFASLKHVNDVKRVYDIACVYHKTFLYINLLPSLYDFMSDFLKKSHSALSLYMYISLMSTPCKLIFYCFNGMTQYTFCALEKYLLYKFCALEKRLL